MLLQISNCKNINKGYFISDTLAQLYLLSLPHHTKFISKQCITIGLFAYPSSGLVVFKAKMKFHDISTLFQVFRCVSKPCVG